MSKKKISKPVPAFKEQMIFCKICNKKTKHATPFIGFPFRCTAIHFGSVENCQLCGKKLEKTIAEHIKAVGARGYCKKCLSSPIRTP